MTVTQKLTDPQLAQLALCLSPPAWKNTWKLLKKGMPQELEGMIQFMEQQENIKKSTAKAKASQNGNQNSNQNGNKKRKAKRHCDLCAKHGVPEQSHNTEDCRIYNVDGNRMTKNKSREDKSKMHNNYAHQFSETREEVKDLKKQIKRMSSKKRTIEESDNNSDA